MKIVIAPDSFKESLDAQAVAEALAEGIREVLPGVDLDIIPMADGGEGTVDALVAATRGSVRRCAVVGPLGEPVSARFGLLGDGVTAVIEMAQASGLALVPEALRDPANTTTFGTGELIRAALDEGAHRIVVGIGGSATHDGGAGMLQALGVRFLDGAGRELSGYLTGGTLAGVHSIDRRKLEPRLAAVSVTAACDVDNPLAGPRGAAAVFGPQKGARPDQIAILDAALEGFYRLAVRQGLPAVAEHPGAGAAGGLGAALLAFLDAELRPGVDLVIEAVGLAERLKRADFVITGEGRIDAQTLSGKTPAGVARVARALGIPVIAVGGGLVDDESVLASGIFAALESAVCRPTTVAQALREARPNLRFAGRRIAQWLRLLHLK